MKLTTLLTQITPLPWPEDGFDMPLTGTALSSAAELSATDYAYARHCANTMPELVKALEDLNCWLIAPDTSPEVLAEMKIKCAYALARANEIKI